MVLYGLFFWVMFFFLFISYLYIKLLRNEMDHMHYAFANTISVTFLIAGVIIFLK
ncbi:hypothetical protein HYU16_05515 [Candidatus Woesearchaeota archaeon]|nr:hypothetical protein [Candidatus Woesearchaeota archaeon]